MHVCKSIGGGGGGRMKKKEGKRINTFLALFIS